MMEKSKLLKSIGNLFSKEEGLDELLKMSEHWDGYKRESAVRRLGMLGNPIAIPNLILRVNDWVPQVRIAALKAMKMLAVPENSAAFVMSLPSLYHLDKCTRSSHAELIEFIEKYLILDINKKHLIQGLESGNSMVARACISLIIKNNLLDISPIVIAGLSHRDFIVRAKASSLIRKLKPSDQQVALELAIKDRFMPIRREAFQIHIKAGASSEFIEPFLFDLHSSIREIAIKHLLDRDVDVASIYINSLVAASLASRLKIAIWGVAELSEVVAISRVEELLASPYASVRKQSLMTMVGLQGEKFEGKLIEFLLDSSPAVCKEAARLCMKLDITFTAVKLKKICSSSFYKHSIASSIGLSKKINKWERLLFLLCLVGLLDQSEFIDMSMVDNEVVTWNADFNKSFSQPTVRQIEELLNAYDKNRVRLSLCLQRSLIITFKTCGFLK